MHLSLHQAGVIVTFAFLLLSNAYANLLGNSDFEASNLTGWYLNAPSFLNTAEVVSDPVHSGARAIKLVANIPEQPGLSVQLYSDNVSVPANALVEASMWIMASGVDRCGNPDIPVCKSWYQLRATLYALDANGKVMSPHWDFLSTDGDICATGSATNCDWKQISFSMTTPSNVAQMRIAVSLTSSTGTVWIDDVELNVLQTLPAPDTSGVFNPIIIPPPWKMTPGNDSISLGSVAIFNHSGEKILAQEISEYFTSTGVMHAFNPVDLTAFSTEFFFGDSNNPEIASRFNQRYPGNNWQELGNEGYFVSVENGLRARVTIGANTERGRYYGLQTAKQLIANGSLYFADILDRPDNSRRGIIMSLPWFNNRISAVNRLSERKANFAWAQGGYLNGSFMWNWREPFNQNQLIALDDFYQLATDNFIDLYLSFGPRIGKTSGICDEQQYPAPMFSSAAEIDLLVNKMLSMYELGYRNFGINFDDADSCGEDVLRYQQDIELFSNQIAAAHVYFVNQVYSRLSATHDDIHFTMMPLWYNQSGNNSVAKEYYLAALTSLNSEITLLSAQVTDEDINTFVSLTQRPTLEWSNYFAELTGKIYTLPYISQFNWDSSKLTGFIFLPATPNTDIWNEDQALVSWNSALSYAWSPDRYDPFNIYNLSSGRYQGVLDPLPVVSIPVISPDGGNISAGQLVTLSTSTPDTSLFYTLDGTVPTNMISGSGTSLLYEEPFILANSATVRARAYRNNFVESDIASSSFDMGPLWVDDAIPTGAVSYNSWDWVDFPTPVTGNLAHHSILQPGIHQHFFDRANEKLEIDAGDILYVYAYLDPDNPPSEIMLQWREGNSWDHRAYWGANQIALGTDGTESRYYMGPLPIVGAWVRLDVHARLVGLEGKALNGMAFTLFDGQVTWDSADKISQVPQPSASDVVWVDDDLPAGALQYGVWDLISSDPAPISGMVAHKSDLRQGTHQHVFDRATDRLTVNVGDTLIVYVYLDPVNPPTEIMVQWRQGESWNHRAYWGEDRIAWGTNGTESRRYIGPLPSPGGWVRLEVPADLVGLEGKRVNGMAFTLFDGQATWDYAGKL